MLLNCGAGEYSRVPWTEGDQTLVNAKGTSPEYSLEGLMLNLKLLYILWPHDGKHQLIEKDADAGKD